MSKNAGVVRELMRAFPDDVVAAQDDAEARAAAAELLIEVSVPDFVTAMVAPDGWSSERNGVEGFFSSWGEFVAGFARFAIELEELIERGDVVVVLARQHGVPKGGSAEITTDGAAIFYFRDSLVERLEFHLDRAQALRVIDLEA